MNITINRNEGGAFFVLHGDRYADRLSYEEMLGLVAQVAMPSKPQALDWLKTGDEWRDYKRQSAERMAAFSAEFIAQAKADEPTDLPTATEIADAWQATGLSPAALREETIAIAVAQDGADARVVGDWNPDAFSIFPAPSEVPASELAAIADPLAAGPALAEMQESGVADLSPINRADVRLKVGDRVTLRGLSGTYYTVSGCNDGTSYRFAAGPFTLTEVGTYYHSGPHKHRADVTTINGRPIIDAEEA
jgi:hypothetical protein